VLENRSPRFHRISTRACRTGLRCGYLHLRVAQRMGPCRGSSPGARRRRTGAHNFRKSGPIQQSRCSPRLHLRLSESVPTHAPATPRRDQIACLSPARRLSRLAPCNSALDSGNNLVRAIRNCFHICPALHLWGEWWFIRIINASE
jgi:hypothetical protein